MKKVFYFTVYQYINSECIILCVLWILAKEPDLVVSTLKGMMETGSGKGIKGTKSFLAFGLVVLGKLTMLSNFVFQIKQP